jgi:(R,R)-butanediol dehydrogenase/meso-butanediol dehydrogenase/diacetyl reductase
VRAAVVGTGRAVRVADIERPAPAAGEVLIDVACCGVCGSDLHMLSAGLVPAGHVLGHEFTGTVAAPGPGVTGWTVGDADAPSLISDLQAGTTQQVKALLAP